MSEEYTKKKSNLIADIDYKNIGFLKKYITESGKISPRRVAGTTGKEQRRVNKAIKIARHLALLPFCDNHKQ
ncbi:MAG: 30S ribosomal protein S18 [Gammaproteobacteria bacterium]|nr:30S ribosomal protein S18 [Gammaproteobacteria bacterium]MBT4461934.1 30S ribosomal protein S18 [Gammaproteobacteria bacterium]MBT4654323.1 30S ribosomal protein S18 [Gammaproteobacteria bacterium]MBT5116894.1 30S ribosomal protein S18 [Gammaproteobacteria bacterium]MBT5761228.1 30S ribosomal protein S18 [Gammaproteobacteria bacterium]